MKIEDIATEIGIPLCDGNHPRLGCERERAFELIIRKFNEDKYNSENITCPRCKYDQFYRPLFGKYRYKCGSCGYLLGKNKCIASKE